MGSRQNPCRTSTPQSEEDLLYHLRRLRTWSGWLTARQSQELPYLYDSCAMWHRPDTCSAFAFEFQCPYLQNLLRRDLNSIEQSKVRNAAVIYRICFNDLMSGK